MNRTRLFATGAASAVLAALGLLLAAPSVALAESPGFVVATGAPQPPAGPKVIAPPPSQGPTFPGTIVNPPKPPKPPIGPGVITDPVIVDPPVGPVGPDDVADPPTPPTPPTGPDEVTDTPPCPTHGSCGATPAESSSPSSSPSASPSASPAGAAGSSGGGLPVTGASIGAVVAIGAAFATIGLLLVAITRRIGRR